jgi:hypothetical protein
MATKKSSKKTAKKSAAKKSTRKYGSSAGKHVKSEMHEMKRGKLKSGRSGKKVKSRKQAIAIGLSEARKKGSESPKKEIGAGNLPLISLTSNERKLWTDLQSWQEEL